MSDLGVGFIKALDATGDHKGLVESFIGFDAVDQLARENDQFAFLGHEVTDSVTTWFARIDGGKRCLGGLADLSEFLPFKLVEGAGKGVGEM